MATDKNAQEIIYVYQSYHAFALVMGSYNIYSRDDSLEKTYLGLTGNMRLLTSSVDEQKIQPNDRYILFFSFNVWSIA